MEKVKKLLEAKGYPDTAIAAIMGNIDVETGGSFDYKQKQRKATKKAQGLFQFDPAGKLPDYKRWLKSNKRKDSPEAQVDFFDSTIFGKDRKIVGYGNADKLQEIIRTGDVPTITQALTDLWFRPGVPHTERRLESAQDIFNAQDQYPAETNRLDVYEVGQVPEYTPATLGNSLLYKVEDMFK